MLVKRQKAKAAKAAPARSAAPKAKTTKKTAKVLRPEFSPEEVISLEQQLVRHQQSETAWQRLTAPPEGDDKWSDVEEHLLDKTQQHEHAERRWKYFAK